MPCRGMYWRRGITWAPAGAKNPLSSGRQGSEERGRQRGYGASSIRLIVVGGASAYPESEQEDNQGAEEDGNIHRPAGEFKRFAENKLTGSGPGAGIGGGIYSPFPPVVVDGVSDKRTRFICG